MDSGFITKIWKILLLFLEEGATVNGDYYLKMLKKNLSVIRRLFGGRKFIIQQDGARYRTSNSVTNYFHKNVWENIREENWPPNSSNLKPFVIEVKCYYESIKFPKYNEISL